VQLLCYALFAYQLILIFRVILSWVDAFGGRVPPSLGPVVRVVYDLTEPILSFFRRFIPPIGMFDISILVVFLLLGALLRTFC
jgi:YggT family protein